MSTVSADLTSPLRTLPYGAVSTTISTYGRPITTDTVARTVYGRLAKGQIVRIPIQWNNGSPCSSAGGGPHDISADDWITAILAMGAKPMIVLGGSADNNFSPSDAANMVTRYKNQLYAVVVGNEFDNVGMNITDYINKIYRPTAQAIRAAAPGVLIAGPAQASYKAGDLQTFINDCKGLYDIIDYHHYGTGTNAPNDAALMAVASTYETEINHIRDLVNAAGQSTVQIQVGEFNLAWQYNDGVPGGDQRFFTVYNTAWSASAVGHILRAGGRAVAYSQQNGPLGIMVEPGNHDNGHPDGTPQPIYHGLGMFAGEGLFASFGDRIMNSQGDASVDCFAGSSGNIVLVNKTNQLVGVNLSVKGVADGVKFAWFSNTVDPYRVPVRGQVAVSTVGTAAVNLKPYQVTTIITATPLTPPVTPTIPADLPNPATSAQVEATVNGILAYLRAKGPH